MKYFIAGKIISVDATVPRFQFLTKKRNIQRLQDPSLKTGLFGEGRIFTNATFFLIFKPPCEVVRHWYLKIIRRKWMKRQCISGTYCLHFLPIQSSKNQNSIESQMKARKTTDVPGSGSIRFFSISFKKKKRVKLRLWKTQTVRGRRQYLLFLPWHITLYIFYGGYIEAINS